MARNELEGVFIIRSEGCHHVITSSELVLEFKLITASELMLDGIQIVFFFFIKFSIPL